MDPRKGFVGKPAPGAIAGFCGKCHSDAELMRRYNPGLRVDQAAEYATSTHGKLAAKGDMKVATCAACHGSHGIRPIADPQSPVYPTNVADTCGRCHSNPDYMKPYSIPADQAEKYKTSIHAETMMKKFDLSAPTCNDCHGNHGAVPPGASSVANACGTCHARQAELFDTSPHKDAFESLGLGQCLVCHSNHDVQHPTDSMIGVETDSVCSTCHNAGEPGYEAAEVMRAGIDSLARHIEQAGALLGRAARAGMEVSRPGFELTSAQGKLIDARVVIHTFAPDDVQGVIQPGIEIAQQAHRAGEVALAELEFRRKGLAASLVVIALAILAIYLKIRTIETRRRVSGKT